MVSRCFAWRIEKCHKVRTAPAWEEGAELSECELDLSLPGLRREGKPFDAMLPKGLEPPQLVARIVPDPDDEEYGLEVGEA